jgi:hypothetical protein
MALAGAGNGVTGAGGGDFDLALRRPAHLVVAAIDPDSTTRRHIDEHAIAVAGDLQRAAIAADRRGVTVAGEAGIRTAAIAGKARLIASEIDGRREAPCPPAPSP